MCPDLLRPLSGNRGIGLMTAIFAIVILALFGVLMARYTVISQTSSAEDYLWAQALYAAESAARLNILRHDQGGKLAATAKPMIGQIPTEIIVDNFIDKNTPATIRVQAAHVTGVSRTVEVKYILMTE